MIHPFDLLIDGLLQDEYGQDNAFLSASLCEGLRLHMQDLLETKQLHFAGIGNLLQLHQPQSMRGDQVYWLDKSHNNPFETAFLMLMDELVIYLNRTCYTGLNSYEFHYALYDIGSSYKRHLDQFQNNQQRQFSLICYLNPDWVDTDGGALLLHTKNGLQSVLPQSQTAVLFKSDELEHEVSIAHRPRMSIAGWLKRS